ncbi:MAG: hypothetical protein LBV63_01210 [Candidatus Methanoplasma sp.]|jgi:hypothetical protein|nr:hypothetical protein [Candidatus Methanoplasma sp.]
MPSFRSEFARSTGSKRDAAVAAVGSICLFLIIPLVWIFIIGYVDNSLEQDSPISSVLGPLKNILVLYIVFSVPMIILSVFTAFYPEGSRSKLVFNLAFMLYAISWAWIVLSGGTVHMDLDVGSFFASDSDIRPTSIMLTADARWFLVILSLLGILKCIIPIGGYKGSRKRYLREHPDKDENEKPVVYTRH